MSGKENEEQETIKEVVLHAPILDTEIDNMKIIISKSETQIQATIECSIEEGNQ
ncbi:33351_t:CDS:1, partial [Gigaspora margarita]